MKIKNKLKTIGILSIIGFIVGGGIAFYLFNLPHRNVQSTTADYTFTQAQIVEKYLNNRDAANEKYLATDGESKILKISGIVSKISDDYNGNKVVLLKNAGDKAGVSAAFTSETNANLVGTEIGQNITVKGVIRSGASYDDDLEMFENVILEKSDIVKK